MELHPRHRHTLLNNKYDLLNVTLERLKVPKSSFFHGATSEAEIQKKAHRSCVTFFVTYSISSTPKSKWGS